MKPRVVFDTSTVLSALIFETGRLAWLRSHWQAKHCIPVICRETIGELIRALGYDKFRLTPQDRQELLAEYVPYCEAAELEAECPVMCRDAKDQMFLDLALSSKAESLVSGDQDLLVLSGTTTFLIETPAAYHRRFSAAGRE